MGGERRQDADKATGKDFVFSSVDEFCQRIVTGSDCDGLSDSLSESGALSPTVPSALSGAYDVDSIAAFEQWRVQTGRPAPRIPEVDPAIAAGIWQKLVKAPEKFGDWLSAQAEAGGDDT